MRERDWKDLAVNWQSGGRVVTMQGTDAYPNVTLVSGCARSGTSLLGRMISTFADTHYEYEPPMLATLVGQIDLLGGDVFRSLWDTYIVSEAVLPSLAGRRLNLNPFDESSTLKYLPESEVARRHSRSWSQAELLPLVRGQHLCLKLPDVSPMLDSLSSSLDNRLKVVLIGRSPLPTISSILERGWFEEGVDLSSIWPCAWRDGVLTPVWVSQERFDEFLRADALGKAALYYLSMHGHAARFKGAVHIRFEELLAQPGRTLEKIRQFLGQRSTAMTERVLNSVQPRNKRLRSEVVTGLTETLLGELHDTWMNWPDLE